jgi:hypothetical protein
MRATGKPRINRKVKTCITHSGALKVGSTTDATSMSSQATIA